MERRRRPLPTAAGWSFERRRGAMANSAAPLMLRRRGRPHPSRPAHARSTFADPPNTRAPQDEDGRAHAALRLVAEPLRSPISRCQTAHLVPAARFLRPGFATSLHSPRIEGWAERRETFGCVRGTRWACT